MTSSVRGIVIGLIVAAVTWISAIPAPPGLVSLFPDLTSLLVLVVLLALSLHQQLRPPSTRSEVMRTARIVGACTGAVVGTSTAVRGIVQWSRPDIVMLTVAFTMSFLTVLLITHVVALIASRLGRRDGRAGA
jgi:hypothetical protein